jgi:hypothetical protein
MMTSQVPPARNSSQSSRFKSALTTVVAAGRIRKAIENADDSFDESSSTLLTLPTPSTPAAALPRANPSNAYGTSTRSSGRGGSNHAATSFACRSATFSSSNFEGSNQTAGVRVGVEVAVIVASSGAVVESMVIPTKLEPAVRGNKVLASPSSPIGVSTGTQSPNKGTQESGIAAAEHLSAMRADGEFLTMPVHGANHVGPGEVEDEYDEPAAWFVLTNTKLHTGSKLFWRIKRSIDFKLYV